VPDVDDPSDLYQLPPEQFTAARDALAKRLRSSGDASAATEVKRLRRPQPTAWAINRVASSAPALLDDLREAGLALKAAFEQGPGQGGLARAAQQREREAVSAVVNAAAQILESAGEQVNDQKRSRIATTLRASLIDPAVAEQLRTGTLAHDVEISGLGPELNQAESKVTSPSSSPPPPPPKAPRVPPKQTEDDRRQREAEQARRLRIAELDADANRLARRAARAAAEAERAETIAHQARAQAEAAQQDAVAAAKAAADAKT
jgi:hypothetical protein